MGKPMVQNLMAKMSSSRAKTTPKFAVPPSHPSALLLKRWSLYCLAAAPPPPPPPPPHTPTPTHPPPPPPVSVINDRSLKPILHRAYPTQKKRDKQHEMYMANAYIFHWLALWFCVGGNANFMFLVGGNANFCVGIVGVGNAKSSRWGCYNAGPQRDRVGVAVKYRL